MDIILLNMNIVYIGRKSENRLNEVVFIVEKRRIKKKGISNYKWKH